MTHRFSEETFPSFALGPGTSLGMAHTTKVTTLQRGAEQRWVKRGNPADAHTIHRNAIDKEQTEALRSFITRHSGGLDSFYFVNPLDNSTAADHIGPHSMVDEWIGVGDGVTTTFDLIKRYERGTQYEKARRCYGMDPLTALIAINDGGVGGAVLQPNISAYGIDHKAGTVTFTAAPGRGEEISGGWTYKTRMRFDLSSDEELGEVYVGFEVGAVNVGLIEDKQTTPTPERMRYGVGRAVLSPKAKEHFSPELGSFAFYLPAAPMELFLPDIRGQDGQNIQSYARTMPQGGPYATIFNASGVGGATITLKEVYPDGVPPKPLYRTITNRGVINPGEARTLFVGYTIPAFDPDGVFGQIWLAS